MSAVTPLAAQTWSNWLFCGITYPWYAVNRWVKNDQAWVIDSCRSAHTATHKYFSGFALDFMTVIVTLGLFSLVTFIYLKLKPTIYIAAGDFKNQCPDRWIFREEEGMCFPTYQTTCSAFNPAQHKGNLCGIAKSCGTTWKGLCDYME